MKNLLLKLKALKDTRGQDLIERALQSCFAGCVGLDADRLGAQRPNVGGAGLGVLGAPAQNCDGSTRVPETARYFAAQHSASANHRGNFAIERKKILHRWLIRSCITNRRRLECGRARVHHQYLRGCGNGMGKGPYQARWFCLSHRSSRSRRRSFDGVRKTLGLDGDLVASAERLARQQGLTLGEVISDLARKSPS